MEKYICIISAVLALSACTRRESTHRDQAPLRVETSVVMPQTGCVENRYTGTVEPVRETPLSLQSAGRVVRVAVHNGQYVRQGETVLEIDPTQAKNALEGAEAALRHAQDGYDRVSKVHDKGVVSDQKMVETESQLAQARSVRDMAQRQLDECVLAAPVSGVVSGLDAVAGQTIIPGTVLCTVLDVSAFNVRFTVPEGEIRAFSGKQALRGTMHCAAADTVLPVVVQEQSLTANALTHTYEVTAAAEGGADVLRSGMVAVVRIAMPESGSRTADIVIPAHCVLLKPEGQTVWVKKDGKAERRLIQTGGYLADGVRVTEGLQAGDTLITGGYQKLHNGCKVTEH